MVCVGSQVGRDVGGFQHIDNAAASDRTASPVDGKELASKVLLASSGRNGLHDFCPGIGRGFRVEGHGISDRWGKLMERMASQLLGRVFANPAHSIGAFE